MIGGSRPKVVGRAFLERLSTAIQVAQQLPLFQFTQMAPAISEGRQ